MLNIVKRIGMGIAYLTLAGTFMFSSGCILHQIQLSLEQKIERVENEKEKYAIVLIDMQDYYLNSIDKDELRKEIPNQIKILKYAQRKDIPIYVLEYKGSGKTTKSLRQVLSNSDYETITKGWGDGFIETNFNELLKQRKINTLILLGVKASSCVKTTAEGALKKGYKIITSIDLIADSIYSSPNESVDWYKSNGLLFKNHFELISYLNSKKKK